MLASVALVVLLLAAGPAGAEQADTFLRRIGTSDAHQKLDVEEQDAVARLAAIPAHERQFSDKNLARLLNSQTPWQPASRAHLKTLLLALPDVARTKGADHPMREAGNDRESHFRGFGFELVAGATLNRYPGAQMLRLSAPITTENGLKLESDGLATLDSGDATEHLVTVKSLSSATKIAEVVRKAATQLARRNIWRRSSSASNGFEKSIRRKPGIIVIAGANASSLEAILKFKRYQQAADHSGAPLTVIAVDQTNAAKVTRIGPKGLGADAGTWQHRHSRLRRLIGKIRWPTGKHAKLHPAHQVRR